MVPQVVIGSTEIGDARRCEIMFGFEEPRWRRIGDLSIDLDRIIDLQAG